MAEIASFGVNVDQNTRLAQNAQDTADDANAKNSANSQQIANINDPNYLSPFEKPQLEIQMDNFATIYAADKDIATSESIDFTAYEAAYQAYVTYMTPLVADMTTYSPIVRATFNSMVTAVQTEQKRFSTATQAQYNQQIKQAQTDIDDGQTKYKALQSEARVMESSVAGISDAADRAISSAGFASNAASEASQGASSAVASAISAQSYASSAVSQASSAAADSKDAKQIAGAVSQSYKTLTDGSTMTIAELQNGLAAKLTKTDLNGYSTKDWTQNKIKVTADGINNTMSSIKNTVDGQTTSINDLKADSSGFKAQFTTVNDTLGKHTTDIGTLQADSSGFKSQFTAVNDTLGTHTTDIGTLQASSKELSSNFSSLDTDINGKLTTLQGNFDLSSKQLSTTISKVDSLGQVNLVYNSGYKNNMDGWNLLGYGYTSTVPASMYQGSIGLGTNYTGKSATKWTEFAESKHMPLPSTQIDTVSNVMSYGAQVKIYGETDKAAGVQVCLSFYNASGARVTGYSGNTLWVNAVNYGQWYLASGVNVPVPADAVTFGIQYWGYGTAVHVMLAHPMIVNAATLGAYVESTIDLATITALTKVKQTADSVQALATDNKGDIAKLQVTAKGLQSTVSDKVSSDQLTQLSDQLTNKISDLSSSTSSQFTQTSKDINGLVKKGDVVNQFNIDAGGALLSTSGNSTKIVFSSPNIIFDSANPVQIPNVNIPGTLTGKTFEAGEITATTKIKGSDIEAPIIHSPSGSFKLDGNSGDIIGASIHSADNSWGIDKNGNINGATINGSTINAPTLDLGLNGTLTTDFDINQPTGFYGPKKGTGTLTIKTGVINYSSDNMSRYSNTAHYWYGFDDHGNVVKNGTNHTGDDYAPGYEKHDIMKSNGNVLNRSYLDAMGLMFSEGGNSTYNTMLTGVGLETATALLHKDLTTNGTFEAALGTGNKYGFTIGSKVVAPMIRANSYTYSANAFISSHGTMGLSTSTKANKLDIVDVPNMLQKGYNLLTLNPRQWFDKTSVEAYADVQAGNTDSVESVVDIKPVSGMVAEEVASAGLDDYVVKDENNKVQGLAYDRLWTLLLPVLRDMNDKINKLQKKEGI